MIPYGDENYILNTSFIKTQRGLEIPKGNSTILIPFHIIVSFSSQTNTITVKKWFLLKHRIIPFSNCNSCPYES